MEEELIDTRTQYLANIIYLENRMQQTYESIELIDSSDTGSSLQEKANRIDVIGPITTFFLQERH